MKLHRYELPVYGLCLVLLVCLPVDLESPVETFGDLVLGFIWMTSIFVPLFGVTSIIDEWLG